MAMTAKGIVKLSQDVIDRIAAGEVVQRPSAALKELLENSVDAGADRIHVTAAEGGLASLSIRDNGSGIHREDLPLLCERYATSKLRCFEDLQSVATFGFRGEALASLSHVAHVSVTTMTADADVAWEASYSAGKLTQGPSATAGNKGTVLTARDMFFNAPTRRRAFANPAEEFTRICDVVTRYAMARPDITFVVQKVGSTRLDVSLPRLPEGATDQRDPRNVVRARFGENVSRNLVPVRAASAPPQQPDDHASGTEAKEFTVNGWISGLKYTGKRAQFTLFVNGRLVSSAPLQRATDHAYAPFLVGSAKPFVFLNVVVPPNDVDVNVHPTKSEVLLLHEEAVVAATYRAVRAVLLAQHESGPREIGSSAAQPSQTQGAGLETSAASGLTSDGPDNLRRLPGAGAGGAGSAAVVNARLSGGGATPGGVMPVIRERGIAERGSLLKYAVPAQQYHLDADRAKPSAAAATIDVDGGPQQQQGNQPALKSSRSEHHTNAAASSVPPQDLSALVAAAAADDENSDDDAAAGDDAYRKRLAASFVGVEAPTAAGRSYGATDRPQTVDGVEVVVSSSTSDADNDESGPDVQAEESLASVVSIQQQLHGQSNDFIRSFARHAKFVGIADSARILIQSRTTLYVVGTGPLLRCAAEQRIFSSWGRLPRYRLGAAHGASKNQPHHPLSVRSLLTFASKHDAGVAGQIKGDLVLLDELIGAIESCVRRWAPMLAEYFGLEFSGVGDEVTSPHLVSVPAPLGTTFPIRLRALPLLVLRLASTVDYSSEEVAFAGIARELAMFAVAAVEDADLVALREAVAKAVAIDSFAPPVALASAGQLQAIVTVEALYKVFERC